MGVENFIEKINGLYLMPGDHHASRFVRGMDIEDEFNTALREEFIAASARVMRRFAERFDVEILCERLVSLHAGSFIPDDLITKLLQD